MKQLTASLLALLLALAAGIGISASAQDAALPSASAQNNLSAQNNPGAQSTPSVQTAPARKPYYAPAAQVYAENPMIVCGNYTLYNFDVPAPTPAPKGFKPFYITTYNRHGARTYGSNTGYDVWYKILTIAHDDGQLTPRGEQLYQEFMAIYPLAAGRAGDLTPKGHEQLREMGMRLYKDYPAVFKGHPVIDACSTTVPRVMLSMAEYCDGLKTCDPSLDIRQRTSSLDRAVLNPMSSANPRVTAKDRKFDSRDVWGEGYLALLNNHIDYDAILVRFFKDPSYAFKGGRTDKMEICRWLYNVAVDLPCLDDGHDLMQFLTRDELFYFWRAENYRFYNVACRSPFFEDRNWALHEVLLRDIVDRAESDMASGDVQVRLRFGHDFYLIALATLLDLDGWNVREADPEKVDAVFRHYEVPMGMNMKFVFYRNKLGEILVKAFLNDRECHFHIAGFPGPYYPWTTFKAFCQSRINLADHILDTTK